MYTALWATAWSLLLRSLRVLVVKGCTRLRSLTTTVSSWLKRAGGIRASLVAPQSLYVGDEITAPGFHILGVGIDKHVTWKQSAAEVIEDIHQQGGVAIAGAFKRVRF